MMPVHPLCKTTAPPLCDEFPVNRQLAISTSAAEQEMAPAQLLLELPLKIQLEILGFPNAVLYITAASPKLELPVKIQSSIMGDALWMYMAPPLLSYPFMIVNPFRTELSISSLPK